MNDAPNRTDAAIGVGVWGIGDHARRTVLPAVAEVEELRLVAIASRNAEVVAAESEKWDCGGGGGLDFLLEADDIDVVIVTTPIGCHADDGRAVLAANKHLWCEKAFTPRFDAAADLAALSKAQDLALCVSCPPLFHPQFQRVSELIAASELGAVRAVDAHFGFPHVAGHSKYDPRAGGGALLDVGFYTLVLGAQLLGAPAGLVSACMETETGYQVDTSGTALLRTAAGAHLTARWGYGRDYVNEVHVIGETGTLEVSPAFSKPPHLPLTMRLRRQNVAEDVAVAEANQFVAMLQAFAMTLTDADARQRFRDQALAQQRLLEDVLTC